jgi:hypothetical protein
MMPVIRASRRGKRGLFITIGYFMRKNRSTLPCGNIKSL